MPQLAGGKEQRSDYLPRPLLAARRTGALCACCLRPFADMSSARKSVRFVLSLGAVLPASRLRICFGMEEGRPPAPSCQSPNVLMSSITSAGLRIYRRADGDGLHTVVRRAGGVAVEQTFGQTFDRTTQKQDDRGESNRNSQHDPITQAADEAKDRANPDRCGCR